MLPQSAFSNGPSSRRRCTPCIEVCDLNDLNDMFQDFHVNNWAETPRLGAVMSHRTGDVDLSNICLGERVRRSGEKDWRKKWKGDKGQPGTVIGYTNQDGRLIGANVSDENNHYNRFLFHQSDERPTVGGGWCAVRWDANNSESIYPIGARGPLGRWWVGVGVGASNVGFGEPCFSLVMATKTVAANCRKPMTVDGGCREHPSTGTNYDENCDEDQWLSRRVQDGKSIRP